MITMFVDGSISPFLNQSMGSIERVPKYIKQLDKHSCGPVAILNLLEWASCNHAFETQDQSLNNLDRLIQDCKCQFGDTYFESFYKVIDRICATTNIILDQIIFKPTDDQIYSHLDKGGAIILLFHWKDKTGSGEHYSLLLNESLGDKCDIGIGDRKSLASNKRRLIQVINSDNPKIGRPITENLNNRELREYIKPYVYKINDVRFADAIDCIFPKAFFFSLSTITKTKKRNRYQSSEYQI